ncbi:hypothetical protein [Paraburkholderia bannensis]|uniref:hypothetical protein n=1 Tax=Paraburkholderia bannensis TaxID=765414 RepID=UPI002AB7E145|nr:hypothetical protein [Paraburkholderia bannensis]
MAASAVLAASAVAASGMVATANNTQYPAVIAAVASFFGTALAAAGAFWVAHLNRVHEKEREAVRRAFDSAGSHMATVAFDNYVKFCEAYTNEYRKALLVLIRNGPCQEATQHSGLLAEVRHTWVLWVTSDIDESLKKFENVMLKLGSDAHLTKPELAASVTDRGEILQRMYRSFSMLVGFGEWSGEELTKELAFDTIMCALRQTLGTDQFGRLRQLTMDRALHDFDQPHKGKRK